MNLIKSSAAGVAIAALVAGAALAGPATSSTSAMDAGHAKAGSSSKPTSSAKTAAGSSMSSARTGRAADTSTTTGLSMTERKKLDACMAMPTTSSAADPECVRLRARAKGGAMGSAGVNASGTTKSDVMSGAATTQHK